MNNRQEFGGNITSAVQQRLQDQNAGLVSPDSRDANYRATNPAQQPFLLPPGTKPDAGWLQGMITYKNMQLKQNEDVRAQSSLDIAHHADTRAERQSQMELGDYGQKQFIEGGMANAYQQGGYGAVIDFLGANAPSMALDFTKQKLSLDNDIMKNQIMRAALPSQQAEILAQGYAAIGKMGYGILQAPEKDRDAMYQQMLPMIKTVNPYAPDTLNADAQHMFMLAAAQAAPANILYTNTKDQVSAQSVLGKLDVDIRSRIDSGETAENSPGLRGLVLQFQAAEAKDQYAQEQLDNLKFNNLQQNTLSAKNQSQALAANYQLTAHMNSNLESESKKFIEAQDNKNQFDSAIESVEKGAGAQGQEAALRTIAMMYSKGRLANSAVAAWGSLDDKTHEALKKLESINNGSGKVLLEPEEIQRLKILADTTYNKAKEKQQNVNDRYEKMAQKFGIDPKDLSLIDANNIDYYQMPNVPKDLAAQAEAAIKAGADKNKVNARIKQLMSNQ